MKRIAIFTLYDNTNYGNRLQNYAGQEILKSVGYQVETIVDIPNKIRLKTWIWRKLYFLQQVKRKEKNLVLWHRMRRIENFEKFNEKYIHCWFHRVKKDNKTKRVIEKRFDKIFVGSDQVWNCEFDAFSSSFFLDFVKKEKRCTMAPSFGIEKIPEQYKHVYIEGLKGFKYLSCREEKGVEIIQELIAADAKRVVDPTLVLTAEEWRKISESSYTPQEEYILTYFLGEQPNGVKEILDKVQEAKIIAINNLFQDDYSEIGPGGFVDLIDHAKLILTDSFHASVFSILLDSPFVVFERYDERYTTMSSRIENLLCTFELEDRKYDEKIMERLYEKNYKKAYAILEKERESFMSFLNKTLKQ